MNIKTEQLESMQAYTKDSEFPCETNSLEELLHCPECGAMLKDPDDDYCDECFMAIWGGEGL